MNKGQHFVAFMTIHHRVIEQISRYLQKHAMPQLFPDTDLRGEVQANKVATSIKAVNREECL